MDPLLDENETQIAGFLSAGAEVGINLHERVKDFNTKDLTRDQRDELMIFVGAMLLFGAVTTPEALDALRQGDSTLAPMAGWAMVLTIKEAAGFAEMARDAIDQGRLKKIIEASTNYGEMVDSVLGEIVEDIIKE